jgi:hypothetical protein
VVDPGEAGQQGAYRVTRLGEFPLLGRLFSLRIFNY